MIDALPIYDHKKLLIGVERAETALRKKLTDKSIELRVIQGSDSNHTLKNSYKKWRKSDGFNWNIYFDQLANEPEKFIVSLHSDNSLLSLSLYDIKNSGESNERLRIHSGEKKPEAGRFRGYYPAIFCQVGLNVSQSLGVLRLTGLAPTSKLIPTYMRIGFSNAARSNKETIELKVREDTELNWNAQRNHLARRIG